MELSEYETQPNKDGHKDEYSSNLFYDGGNILNLSVYKNANQDKTGVQVSLETVVEYIKEGKNGIDKKTLKCRKLSESDPVAYREYKPTLPAVTFAGTFEKRGSENIIQHSGCIVYDVDHLDPSKVDVKIEVLKENPHVLLAFKSPSGKGIKIVVKFDPIPANNDQHKLAWAEGKNFINISVEFDKQCKEQGRLCFLAHDPDIYYNPNAQSISWDPTKLALRDEQIAHFDTLDLDDNAALLEYIDPDSLTYNEWLTVLTGCKEGGIDKETVEAWSAKGSKHRPNDLDRWDGLGGYTFGNVVYHARQGGFKFPKGRPKSEKTKLKEASPYFLGTEFNVRYMAEELKDKYQIWKRFKEGELYVYNPHKGIYESNELQLRGYVRAKLGDLEQTKYVKEAVEAVRDRFDVFEPERKYDHYIAFSDVVYDLENDEILDHSPDYFLTSTYPIEWELGKNRDIEEWHNLFGGWPEKYGFKDSRGIAPADDVEKFSTCFSEFVGSIFHKRCVDMAKGLLIQGDTSSGKSLLLEIVEQFLGIDEVFKAKTRDLMKDFGLEGIEDKSLMVDRDISKYIADIIKDIITGDGVRINAKFQRQRQNITPYVTFIGLCNEFPAGEDNDAFYDRFILMLAPQKFERDGVTKGRITSIFRDKELQSAVVRHCIGLYREAFFENRCYTIPDAHDAQRQKLVYASNDMLEWFTQFIEEDKDNHLVRSDTWGHYKSWGGRKKQKDFYNYLDEKLGRLCKFDRKQGWMDYRLVEEDEFDDEVVSSEEVTSIEADDIKF